MTDARSNESNFQKADVPPIFTITLANSGDPEAGVNAFKDANTPRDFEEAIEATGFGKFNYFLLLASLPGGWTSILDTSTMSYILAVAECDLELDLNRKGLLNAVVYTGMISGGFIWGILADTRGRKSLLLFGYLADGICNLISSTSQTFWVLFFFKFLSGFIICGPFAILMTFISEFQNKSNRSKTIMWIGTLFSLGNIVGPALAWGIIPRSWSIALFDGGFVFNSWRIYILASSAPGLVAFFCLLNFPESPKFLMSQGRNEEALAVFRRIYALNTGKLPETFPIKVLRQEVAKKNIQRSASSHIVTVWDKFQSGWNQIKPLFRKPYVGPFVLLVTIQFGSILGMNTLRLWLPQLFTSIENFDYDSRDPGLGAPTLCEMISIENTTVNSSLTEDPSKLSLPTICVPPVVREKVYTNSMIIALTMFIGYSFAGRVINLVGKKKLLLIEFFVPAVCTFAFNWSTNSDLTLAIASIFVALTSIATMTVIGYTVELMPTASRTTALSLAMCVGRSGAVFGNILFPIFLSMGCILPFMVLGGFLSMCFILSIFIPKPTGRLL